MAINDKTLICGCNEEVNCLDHAEKNSQLSATESERQIVAWCQHCDKMFPCPAVFNETLTMCPTCEQKGHTDGICAACKPVESRLTAEEKLLFQAILRAVDDKRRGLWAHPTQYMTRPTAAETAVANAGLEAEVNRERLDFADAVIDTWRKFKLQDGDESIRERR